MTGISLCHKSNVVSPSHNSALRSKSASQCIPARNAEQKTAENAKNASALR